MEETFGTYYTDSVSDNNIKFPGNLDYLRANNIFSYGSDDAKQWCFKFRQKIDDGAKVYLLGFQSISHNSGISLIEASKAEGLKLYANYEEERFTGIKHFSGYPEKSVKELKKILFKIGKSVKDIFCILHSWDITQLEKNNLKSSLLRKSITSNELYLYLSNCVAPKGKKNLSKEVKNYSSLSSSFVESLRRLISDLKLDANIPCIQMGHHDNHAYYSYAVSPFYTKSNPDQKIMISCIDGNSDSGSASLYIAEGKKIDRIKCLASENSLGVFYMLFASFLGGWSPLSSEGRYMGAAAWGNYNRLTNPYYKRLRQYFYFSSNGDIYTNSTMTANEYSTIQDIVGPFLDKKDIWNPDAVLNVENIDHSLITRDRVDKAAAVQMVFEDALFHIIAYLINVSQSNSLVLCGGTALNCVANMRLLEHFDRYYYRRYLGKDTYLNIWVPPIPSDQGVVPGAAFQFCMRNGITPVEEFSTPFLCGLPPSTKNIIDTLEEEDFLLYDELGNINDTGIIGEIADWMAYIISQNGVIGIFQGEAETGPRALGHRSILANPCNPDSLQIINDRVKLRERIRPLAPIVTLEDAQKWFHLLDGGSANNYDAYNYMVLTVKAKDEARKVIPAVIHHDGTSRIQIVREENNLLMFEYLKALKKYIGVEVSVNTSLNVGSAIVQTPSQTLQLFKRAKGLDCIFMIGHEGNVFMVWSKPGVQEYNSNIANLSKEYLGNKSLSENNKLKIKFCNALLGTKNDGKPFNYLKIKKTDNDNWENDQNQADFINTGPMLENKFQEKSALTQEDRGMSLKQITSHEECILIQADRNPLPWVGIHDLSGEINDFMPLLRVLASEHPVIAIKPGQKLNTKKYSIDELAHYYCKIICDLKLNSTFQLIGYGYGGIIACEIVRQLQNIIPDKSIVLLLVDTPFINNKQKKEKTLLSLSDEDILITNANQMLLNYLNDSIQEEFFISKYQVENICEEQMASTIAGYMHERGIILPASVIEKKLIKRSEIYKNVYEAFKNFKFEKWKYPERIKICYMRSNLFKKKSELSDELQRIGAIQISDTDIEQWADTTPNIMFSDIPTDNIINPLFSSITQEHISFLYRTQIKPFFNQSNELNKDKVVDILKSLKKNEISVLEAHEKLIGVDNSSPNTSSISSLPNDLDPVKSNHEFTIKDEASVAFKFHKHSNNIPEPIAIIGMSGRFPDAENVQELWDNLIISKNSIKEVPDDRGWDISDYFNSTPKIPGKTYSKWGGFLSNIAQFDPSFFRISPREAKFIDPSERNFLQESWRAIEDAGYDPAGLHGKKWGVFACAKGDYPLKIQKMDETYLLPTDSYSPGRLSYFLNLIGPAVTVDTACSSTLSAIAYACDSLSIGNCEAAIVGGGGIYTTPNILISLSQSLLFSPSGQCYAFDQRADGTVLGEAIGVIILKPVEQAVRDGDQIYGVIKGWGTNQDGKTNGMSAPSVLAQSRLQTDIYRKFNIDVENISMVEAHGTGTRLGDLMEFEALTESFRKYTKKAAYCALGSLKTNIGHAFFGAGVAGVIKILLSLQHSIIPPTLNFKSINPKISIKTSPFYISEKVKKWENELGKPRSAAISSFGVTGINAHLVIEEYIPEQEKPKRIIENNTPAIILLSAKSEERLKAYAETMVEFLEKVEGSVSEVLLFQGIKQFLQKTASIILKVREEEIDLDEDINDYGFDAIYFAEFADRINEKYDLDIETVLFNECTTMESLAQYIYKEHNVGFQTSYNEQQAEISIFDIAYTLQVGREAMEERLAVIVHSLQELKEKLNGFLKGKDNIENFYRGQVKRNKETFAVIDPDVNLQKTIDAWIAKGKYSKILELWVKGLVFDWNKLYGDIIPRRISLPTYPFSGERYWISEVDNQGSNVRLQAPPFNSAGSSKSIIHPLLHQNTSDLYMQRFSSTFTGKEFFLSDLVVKDQCILSSMAYLEMVRVAVELGAWPLKKDNSRIILNNVVWDQPITVKDQVVFAHIGLFPQDNGNIAYEIYCDRGEEREPMVIGGGSALLTSGSDFPHLDLAALQTRCNQKILPSSLYYNSFKSIGIEYGKSYRCIDKVYVGSNQLLVKLIRPSSISDTYDQFILHPCMMEAVSHAVIGYILDNDNLEAFLPVSLQQLEIFNKFTPVMWASIQGSNLSRTGNMIENLDIDLCDEQGDICVRMTGLSMQKILETSVFQDILKSIPSAGSFLSHTNKKPIEISLSPLLKEYMVSDRKAGQNHQPCALSSISGTSRLSDTDAQQDSSNYFKSSVTIETLKEDLKASFAKALFMERNDVDVDESFIDMGMDSIIGVEWIRAINIQYGVSIQATKVYDYKNIREFAEYLAHMLKKQEKTLNKIILKPEKSLSLQNILQQVQQGNLEIDQADQLLDQLYS